MIKFRATFTLHAFPRKEKYMKMKFLLRNKKLSEIFDYLV